MKKNMLYKNYLSIKRYKRSMLPTNQNFGKVAQNNTIKSFVNLLLLFIVIFLLLSCQTGKSDEQIFSVQGPVNPTELGMSLTHEHLFSNFGKEITTTSNYDSLALFDQVMPYVEYLKSLGIQTIFDCTTAYFGRRADFLKKIADSTGIQIVTNTGFYGAANDRYIPEFAYEATAQSISKIWVDEFEGGIDGTSIKPGFIKLAFDEGETPSDIDKKLFEAGVLAHLRTGLALAVHTGKNIEAVTIQHQLMEKYNVDLSAWIWTHANKVEEDHLLIEWAEKGAWISLDGVKESNIDEYIRRIKSFKQKNLLNKLLLSHDGNGFPGGGEIRPFEAIFTTLIPAMLDNGLTENDVNRILVENPKEAFTIRPKRR